MNGKGRRRRAMPHGRAGIAGPIARWSCVGNPRLLAVMMAVVAALGQAHARAGDSPSSTANPPGPAASAPPELAIASTGSVPIKDQEAKAPRVRRSDSSGLGSMAGGSLGHAWGLAATIAVAGGLVALGAGVIGSHRGRWITGRETAPPVRVVGRVALTPRHAIHVVRAGERTLLIGTGQGGSPALLGELPGWPIHGETTGLPPGMVSAPDPPRRSRDPHREVPHDV